jgi:hypothetical protein
MADEGVFIHGLADAEGSLTSLRDACEDPSVLRFDQYRLAVSTSGESSSNCVPASLVEDSMSNHLQSAFESFFGPPAPPSLAATTEAGSLATDDSMNVLVGDALQYTEEDDEDEDEEGEEGEAAGADPLQDQEDLLIAQSLLTFVRDCIGQGVITKATGSIIAGLVGDRDLVLRAAYVVCRQRNSAQLLAVLLKASAEKQLTASGLKEHRAQEELVEVVQLLADESVIPGEDMIRLFDHIVHKSAPIVKAYEEYVVHERRDVLMRDIVQLAQFGKLEVNGGGFTAGGAGGGADGQDGGAVDEDDYTKDDDDDEYDDDDDEYDDDDYEDDDEDDEQGGAQIGKSGSWEVESLDTVDSGDHITTPRSATAAGRAGSFADVNAQALAHDQDSAEEMVKVAESMCEEGLFSPADTSVLCDLVRQAHPGILAAFDRWIDEDGEEDEDDDDGEFAESAFGSAFMRVMRGAVSDEKARREAVAEAHAKHEQGSWDAVPKEFLNLLQVVESKGILSHDDALLVCNAFIQKFELVHAAWEVFEQDGDEAELLDTTMRIVRSGKLHAQMAALVRDQEDQAAAAAQTVAGGMGPSDGGFYDDEGGGDDEQLTAGQIELLEQVAAELVATKALSFEQSRALLGMGLESDEMVVAAVQVYAIDGDTEELKDTLKRIAEFAVSPEGGFEDEDERREKDADEGPKEQLIELVKNLHEDDILDDEKAAAAMMLIKRRDPRMIAAHEAYVASRDLDDLIDTLMAIATHFVGKSPMETFLENTANNDFDDDGEDDENDEDYEDGFEDDEDEDEDEDDYEDEDDVQSGDGMKLSTDDRQGIIMMMMEVRRSCLGLFVRLFASVFTFQLRSVLRI